MWDASTSRNATRKEHTSRRLGAENDQIRMEAEGRIRTRRVIGASEWGELRDTPHGRQKAGGIGKARAGGIGKARAGGFGKARAGAGRGGCEGQAPLSEVPAGGCGAQLAALVPRHHAVAAVPHREGLVQRPQHVPRPGPSARGRRLPPAPNGPAWNPSLCHNCRGEAPQSLLGGGLANNICPSPFRRKWTPGTGRSPS